MSEGYERMTAMAKSGPPNGSAANSVLTWYPGSSPGQVLTR